MMYSNLFFIERFHLVYHELNELLEGVDENVFLRVPKHGGWSIGEVISHINKTTDLYLSQMEPPFDKKGEVLPKGDSEYYIPWTLRAFVKAVSPEFNLKLCTFPAFFPQKKADLKREALLFHFNQNMNRFVKIAERAEKEHINLDKIKVRNPIIKILKMPVSVCLIIHERHTQRHIEQIMRLISKT